MAIIKLKSDNPHLSWVINKNPEKNVILKKNNHGHFVGFFIPNGYCVYFRDHIDKNSYKAHPNDVASNGISSYTNARIICVVIKDLFKSTIQKVEERDIPSLHTFEMNLLSTDERTMLIFQKYFPDYNFVFEKKGNKLFNVIISNTQNKTMFEFLKFITLFGIIAAINSDDFIFIEEGLIDKYVKIAKEIDAPYFIRYIIKLKFLTSEKKFKNFVSALEESTTNDFKLVYGDTHDARISFIKEETNFDLTTVIDFGVGSDYRYLRFLKDRRYIGIEKDLDALFKINRYIKDEGLENVTIFESFEEFLQQYKLDLIVGVDKNTKFNIICTEVLEHNTLDEVDIILIN